MPIGVQVLNEIVEQVLIKDMVLLIHAEDCQFLVWLVSLKELVVVGNKLRYHVNMSEEESLLYHDIGTIKPVWETKD